MVSTRVSKRVGIICVDINQFINVGDDKSFTDWNGTIIGPPNTAFDMRIMSLSIKCGDSYPAQPPTLKFISKVNLPFVDKNNGSVTK